MRIVPEAVSDAIMDSCRLQLYPFTQIRGRSRATRCANPARSADSTTAFTSLYGPAAGLMGMDVVDGNQRRGRALGQSGKMGKPTGIVAAIEMLAREIDISGKAPGEMFQQYGEPLALGDAILRQHDQDQALAMRIEIGQIEMAFPLGRAPAGQRDQAAEPAIGGAIGGIGQQAAPAAEIEAAANNKPDANLLRRLMGAHHAGEAVAVGERHGREA